ncbi:hypothetical protein [Kineosporia succinea]|uniref:Uncharacterized protein n=1 Tax=Kineosporia succinea TaxID=84632 RepID=A0ABT9NXU0_9ACTN|nr:hypothetical protein [Kineosporia succinea]MDP9825243.1 hypothetical protein [Kineosporia succinea]
MTTITVVAGYLDLVTLTPARGKVRFTPLSFVHSDDGTTLLVPTPVDVPLDEDGTIAVILPIGNDPDFAPTFSYRVEEFLRPTRVARRPYTISPVSTEDPLDLIHSVSVQPG